MDIEKLIICVKKYPPIYDWDDIDHRNVKKKDQIWVKIGEELNENGEELRKKWKNLRDCYARHIRSANIKNGEENTSANRYYKTWPWAKQMDIFKPYLKCTKQTEAKQNISTDFNEFDESKMFSTNEESCDRQQQMQCDTPPLPQPTTKSKKRKHEAESSVDKIIKFLQDSRKTPLSQTSNLSATEHMFISFAKTTETFSARKQALVKMRIANIILEEELLQIEEDESALRLTNDPLGEIVTKFE